MKDFDYPYTPSITMKPFLLFFFLFLVSGISFSQDLIITNTNDSIRCKITGIEGNDMYYECDSAEKRSKRAISLSNVTYYVYSFYKVEKSPRRRVENSGYQYKGRLALNTGYSYCYASTVDFPAEYKDIERGIKSGFHFGGDFSAYLSKHFGLGFKALFFKSGKEELEGGNISDDISVGYIAPQLCLRSFSLNQRNMLFFGFSMGYAGFTNKSEYYVPVTKKSSTFAWGIDLGYEFGISEHAAVGFQFSTLGGRLKRIENTVNGKIITVDLDKEDYEHLGRIDLSVGLRFWF
jgi:hypothetical protein